MSRRLEDLHALLVGVWKAAEMVWKLKHPDGPEVFVTYTYRSGKVQDDLHAQPYDNIDNDRDGRVDERDEFVTNAKAGQSPHNYQPSFAFDIAFKKNGKLDWSIELFNEFAQIVKQQPNGEKVLWGGDFRRFKDRPHFELHGWKQMVAAKKNEPVIYEVKTPYMRGSKVKEIQQKLGISPRDGVYGPKTEVAVKAFQVKHKLLADGKVGPMTAAKMGIQL